MMIEAFCIGFLIGMLVQAILILQFGMVIRPYSWAMQLRAKLRRYYSRA